MAEDRAFVVMQVGAKDSHERKRADEIYEFIVRPALEASGLQPYRADLDPSPGAITPKLLQELVNARLVIADLTGRNPNVYYELGIAHAFAKPLISIADAAANLPFDAKDERVIELGEYSDAGLTYAQGEAAKVSLELSLDVVLRDGYVPPSPLREIAANRSLDELAPDNPVAAELAQVRETLVEIRNVVRPRVAASPTFRADLAVLREFISDHVADLPSEDLAALITTETSLRHDRWVRGLLEESEEDDE